MAESRSSSQPTQQDPVPPPSQSQPQPQESEPQTKSQDETADPPSSSNIDPNNSTSTAPIDDEEMNTSAPKKDVTMGGTEEENTSGSSNTAAGPAGSQNSDNAAVMAGLNDINPIQAALPPTKKDTSLREFLSQMDEYAPIIPDAVTAHYLTLAGLPPPGTGPNHTPPHLARLLALTTQKFIADIATDAYQYSRIRASNSSSSNNPMGSLNVTGAGATGTQAPGAAGAAGAPGAAAGGDASKNKGPAAASGTLLGVQRPGFGGGGQGGNQGRTVLTMEDLGMAVAEYGVSVKRGEFYR